jgi:hypothetical protein
LHPVRSELTVYQIYVNPLTTIFDQCIVFDDDGYYDADRGWDGRYEVKSAQDERGWSVEMAIPLSQLGVSGNELTDWGINFRRKQKRLDTAGDWQVPIDYHPSTFGVLKFE